MSNNIGLLLFLEACVIENAGLPKKYKITKCPDCGYYVQLEQSNGVCWHCHPLYDPPPINRQQDADNTPKESE